MTDPRIVRTSFGPPHGVNEAPRMVRRECLQPGECSDVPPTKVTPILVDQNGTPYTDHPHRLLFCVSDMNPPSDLIRELVLLHKQGHLLYAVREPFTDGPIQWEESQCRAMAVGDRVISLFGVWSQCAVVWTCYSQPRVPKYRFVMMQDDFEYEFFHGFPVEKYIDSLNLNFPLEEDARKQLQESLQRSSNTVFSELHRPLNFSRSWMRERTLRERYTAAASALTIQFGEEELNRRMAKESPDVNDQQEEGMEKREDDPDDE